MNFAHLHCHSTYSLLDGQSKIPLLVKRVAALGMDSIAVTDHGNMHGFVELMKECKNHHIKPIAGIEAYIAPGSRLSKDLGGANKKEHSFHLTLLAQNGEGVRNLFRLSSKAFLEGFYYKPRIDKEILELHSEGVICLSGCVSSEFSDLLLAGQIDEAERLADWYQSVFKERFFVEIQDNGVDIQKNHLEIAVDFANRKGIPLVATSDAHYLTQDDAVAHDVLLCINTHKTIDDPNRMKFDTNQFHIRSPDEMLLAMPDHSESIKRTQEIADGVEEHYTSLNFGKRCFPAFETPGTTPEQKIRDLCYKGLDERYATVSDVIRERLEYELDIVCRMGFASYFLIVWDFVNFAREKDIPCGARGSACGSIVSYLLYLSHVDPIEHTLLFERFLDPNRAEAPDIDIDICQEGRQSVIDYVRNKYGNDHVAQIVTFGTLGAKNSVKDVSRALSFAEADEVTKLIPDGVKVTIADAIERESRLKELIAKNPAVAKMIDLAQRVEGTARNCSTHAAGVVITPQPLIDLVPLMRITSKTKGDPAITTQWSMNDIEKAGLLKMDFLGLRNLTVLSKAVKLIRMREKDFDLYKLPLDDIETYGLLQRGETRGIFQLESSGIRELLVKMKPDQFNDIIAVAALYRPGPLEGGMVDSYVERKHGRESWDYPHPVMKGILDPTYGVLCIHEDTNVSMSDGSEKVIRDVVKGDYVQSLNTKTEKFEIKECHGCAKTRFGDGIKITLKNGYSVIVTPDHQLYTTKGMVEAQNLDVDIHAVACPDVVPIIPTSTEPLADWLGSDEDVAYLLGYITGNGSLVSSGISICTGEKHAHDKFVAWIESRIPSLHTNKKFRTRAWYVDISHEDLANLPEYGNRKKRLHVFFESLDMKHKSIEKRIPKRIMTSSIEVQRAFFAGLFDADGCVPQNNVYASLSIKSSSPGLVQDIRRMSHTLGFVSHISGGNQVIFWNGDFVRDSIARYCVTRPVNQTPTSGCRVGYIDKSNISHLIPKGKTLYWFAESLGMNGRTLSGGNALIRRDTAFKTGVQFNDLRYYKIKSIEKVSNQQFYGMSVSDNHNLVANGIVVKNCYQESVMLILNQLGKIPLAKAYATIKAISKKKLEDISVSRDAFLAGCTENGVAVNVSQRIFEQIEFFGGYGFNKCLEENSIITDAHTGQEFTIGEICKTKRKISVHTMNEAGKIEIKPVVDAVYNGKRSVYKLTTNSGKEIVATGNHPFYTISGWKNLEELKPRDSIASPARMCCGSSSTMSKSEIVILAGLLSEGNTCHPTSLYIYNTNQDYIDDIVCHASVFPMTKIRIESSPNKIATSVVLNTGLKQFLPDVILDSRRRFGDVVVDDLLGRENLRCGAFRWAESLGILGKKATQKSIPDIVFSLDENSLCMFIGRLWSGDGFVANHNNATPYYSTSSREFAGDVQRLLLRLGMNTKLATKKFKYRGGYKIGYTVHLIGENSVNVFVDKICDHIVGQKSKIYTLMAYHSFHGNNKNTAGLIPFGIVEAIRDAHSNKNHMISGRRTNEGFRRDLGFDPFVKNKTGFRRTFIDQIAEKLDSNKLREVSNSDVFWDVIKSIEPCGESDVYDLEIEGNHNFVANGMFVHNSHSTAYALIAYHTAYLKCHYPSDFMAALLSSETDGQDRDKLTEHIDDCRRIGIDVKPPDLNECNLEFFRSGTHEIKFGLGALKGIGASTIAAVIENRTSKYRDIADLMVRVPGVTQSHAETLIASGALDSLGLKRSQMLSIVPKAAAEAKTRKRQAGQRRIFDDDAEVQAPNIPELPDDIRLALEKESVGFYISGHPLMTYGGIIDPLSTCRICEIDDFPDKHEVLVSGMISNLTTRALKKSRSEHTIAAFATLEDLASGINLTFWPEAYHNNRQYAKNDQICLIRGTIDRRRDKPELVASEVIPLSNASSLAKAVVIRTSEPEKLLELARLFPGTTPLYAECLSGDVRLVFRTGLSIDFSSVASNVNDPIRLIGQPKTQDLAAIARRFAEKQALSMEED